MGISEIIATRRDAILTTAARHGVTKIRVFGSVARGDARNDSDVDFLVEVGPQHSAFFPGDLWPICRKSSDDAWTSSSLRGCTTC